MHEFEHSKVKVRVKTGYYHAFCHVGGTHKDHAVVSAKGLDKLGHPSPLNALLLVHIVNPPL